VVPFLDNLGARQEEGGRRKEEGGRRKEEGGRRKEEGERSNGKRQEGEDSGMLELIFRQVKRR
jgi:hypothetical protein